LHSLKIRLLGLWVLSLVACVPVGFLLVQLYQQSTEAQVGRAEAVVARACDLIRDRYGFYATGWSGPEPGQLDDKLRSDLATAVGLALAHQDGVEGGFWQSDAGPLAYAFPTYEGTGPKTDLPTAERNHIQTINQQAARDEQSVDRRTTSGSQTLLLHACPLNGPINGLTAWTMTRVRAVQGFRPLQLGLGVLLALMALMSAWLGRTLLVWGRHVRGIEAALRGAGSERMPVIARTGERELDQIIDALNEAGRRLAEARREADAVGARIAQAERLAGLGRVAAGVAHEIRNPIAAARLQGENALAGDDARRREAIGDMLGQIDRLDGLVGELLAMTQRVEPKPGSVDLGSFLASQVARHREVAAAKALTVEVRGGKGNATFDPAVIGRVLDNLLTNAIRHAPEGGTIVLGAVRCPGLLTLAVEDTGPGVSPDIAERLFEPFVTGRPDGTGLGLAIARELADAHGGTPDVGRGRAPDRWCDVRAGASTGGRMATVLIVDDDKALRRAVAVALGDLGHQTAEADDGEQALAWLSRQQADAVLLDLRMPGMDGMDVLRRIRAKPNPPPVAVLTAVPSSENTIEAMRLGAADHLAKPIGRDELKRLLQRMLPAGEAGSPSAGPASSTKNGDLVGASAAMREVQKSIGLLADSNATVLLFGETGTGKEVVARAIHRHGRRAKAPFVPVNCAAIPAELLESLLFGHVRGAFTGAVADRPGSFRDAKGGTLFLDEIGDMDLAMQAKLLRALQERVVTPVGGRPVPIDVRVVAATHRDCCRPFATADSGRTCITALAWCPWPCRRCGNAWPTSSRSPSTSWRCPPRPAPPNACLRTPPPTCWPTPGQETSANCSTP